MHFPFATGNHTHLKKNHSMFINLMRYKSVPQRYSKLTLSFCLRDIQLNKI